MDGENIWVVSLTRQRYDDEYDPSVYNMSEDTPPRLVN